ASETHFLTTLGDNELQQRVRVTLLRDVRAVALMTDGVADDSFPESKRLIELLEGDPIADLKTPQGEPLRGLLHGLLAGPREGQALAEWLRYEKRGSSDDRTLVLLHRFPCPAPPEIEPSAAVGVPGKESEAAHE